MHRARKHHSRTPVAIWAALLIIAGASGSVAQTSSCGTCRNPNDAQDRSYCDPVTNQCVHQVASCPPFFVDAQGNQNLCEPNYGVDAQTGQCLYRPKTCNPTGCFNESCNPTTGSCELVTNDARANFICGGSNSLCVTQAPGFSCPSGACLYFACDPSVSSQNCATFVPVNCFVGNVSTCQSGVATDPTQSIDEFSCQVPNGCVYTATTCAPPSDPCQVLVRNSNVNGCCTYQPRDCAAEYGNNPNFIYSCNPNAVNGVCQAQPKPTGLVGPPLSKDECKNGGWRTFNYPRVFKNQGDCVSFVVTGK